MTTRTRPRHTHRTPRPHTTHERLRELEKRMAAARTDEEYLELAHQAFRLKAEEGTKR